MKEDDVRVRYVDFRPGLESDLKLICGVFDKDNRAPERELAHEDTSDQCTVLPMVSH